MSSTSMRTHQCGELRSEHIGQSVALTGWVGRRREHGDKLAFVDIRDHTGITQCVVDNDVDVRSEYVVRITGVVRARPDGTVNSGLPTGEVEVGECQVEVLRSAIAPPFPIDARADGVDENLRLKHRYLDLRRERMQKNLRVRAAVNAAYHSRDAEKTIRGGKGVREITRNSSATSSVLRSSGIGFAAAEVAAAASIDLTIKFK